MCTILRYRLVPLVLVTALAACAGGITLPDHWAPASLEIVSGDGQEGTAGSQLDAPLIVRVTDANSNPVAGVPVTFRFQGTAPEGEVDPAEGATNSDGIVAAEVRLSAISGTQVVEASVAEVSALRATFGLTALAPDEGGGKKDNPGKGGRDRGWGQGHDDDDDDDDNNDDDD